ncbi:MAG: DUF4396 domain-containing protein, partial [Bauldia litoralis]
RDNPAAHDPTEPLFWFRMSVALMAGFAVAYPMNWWLVAHHLKHGMLTVRPSPPAGKPAASDAMPGMTMDTKPGAGMAGMDMSAMKPPAPRPPVPVMAAVSFAVLAAGLLVAWIVGGLSG